MSKAFIKYFLGILILFLSGSSNSLPLNKQTTVQETRQPSVLEQGSSEETTAILHVSKLKHHLEPYEIELEEEDEEKNHSRKRISSTGKYILVLCLALLLGYYHNPVKRRIPSNEPSYHFSFFKWFVLFQVFRI